nr:hypothetical protein [Campylobacter sp.]
DRIVFDANDSIIDAGEGFDTLIVKSDTNFSSIENLDSKVNSVEALDMRNSQSTTITLSADDVLELTDNKDTVLKIFGDGGGNVHDVDVIKGNWSLLEDQSAADQGFTLYKGDTSSNETIFIQIDDNVKIETL